MYSSLGSASLLARFGLIGMLAPCVAGVSVPAMAQSEAIPVTTVSVTRQDVPVLLRNIGAVQAFQSVLIRPRVDGTIDKVLFTEGQDVKPGDKLVQIDPRPYAATLAAAQAKKASDQANLVNAQRDLARYTSLAKSDFASKQQMDTQAAMVAQGVATVQGDDAAIATAQLNLDFTNITSPIEGRTGLRLVDAGNLVHATDVTGLVMITQIRPISVIFTLPQDDLPEIQAAMATGTLTVTAYTADDRTSARHRPIGDDRQHHRPVNRHDQAEVRVSEPGFQALAGPVRECPAAVEGIAQRADRALRRCAARTQRLVCLCGEAGFHRGRGPHTSDPG